MIARAAAGAAEGDWIVARRQTAGRGRGGRIWTAPEGNLFASGLVRLRPLDPPAPTLALVAGLAAWDAAAAWLPPGHAPLLKWPNDLMVGAAKLAGILLERRDDAVVIGIGINLAARPEGLDRPATSLADEGAIVPRPMDAAAILAARFEHRLATWRGEGLAAIRQAWMAHAHPVGTPLRARVGQAMMDGVFDGLDAAGALRLRVGSGVMTVAAGDVFLL